MPQRAAAGRWRIAAGREAWSSFGLPLAPSGSAARCSPPPDARVEQPGAGPRTRDGIYRGSVRHAGGRMGPGHHCIVPLDRPGGPNFKTGVKMGGGRPVVD
eukprot:4385821-Pyramimonas_sp.AAC.1